MSYTIIQFVLLQRYDIPHINVRNLWYRTAIDAAGERMSLLNNWVQAHIVYVFCMMIT